MKELKPSEESLDGLKDELCKYAKEVYLTAYEDGAQGREFFDDGLDAEFAERIGNIVDERNRRAAPENKALTCEGCIGKEKQPRNRAYWGCQTCTRNTNIKDEYSARRPEAAP